MTLSLKVLKEMKESHFCFYSSEIMPPPQKKKGKKEKKKQTNNLTKLYDFNSISTWTSLIMNG